jgi:two-component system, cell cycle sensor histidine kinase and response regulator CckA
VKNGAPTTDQTLELSQALFQESADALFLLDPTSGRLLDVNPVALRLTGFNRSEILEFPASYLFRSEHQGGRTRLRGAVHQTMIFHAKDGYLLRTTNDGVWIPVNLSVSRLHVRPRALALITIRDIRERHEAELRLRRLEAELSRLTASISACLWSAETTGAGAWTYRYWSPVVERITGRPPDFFLSGPDKWESVVHPEDRAAWKETLARHRQGLPGPETEYRVVRPEGAARWVREDVTVGRLPGEGATRLDAVVTDVTERRAAVDAVREQAALLEQVIAHVPCAVFWKDRQGVYLGCNEQSARDLGLDSAAQIVGKTDYELQFDREEADFFVRCDREVMERGRPLLDIEETQHRPGGEQAALLTNKVPLRDASGEVVGLLGVYADITRRKKAEEALRKSEEKYRALFERNPHPMFVYDPDTLDYLAVNDAAVHQYGYSRDEFSRMTLQDLRPPEDVPALLEMLSSTRPVFERRGVWRHRKKDGSVIDVEITAHAMQFGDRDAFIVAALDVTDRRRLEEQLRQSQKMEAVGRLAGGVAHDFNNLLTVIQGYGSLLVGQLDPSDPAEAMAREVLKAAERAAELTGQLLAFGRKAITAPRLLDLNAVIADAERMLRRVIGEDVELAVDLGSDARPIRADPGQLHQVLMNLAVNARDAMPRGGRLTLRTRNARLDEDRARERPGACPGSYVLLEVSDTGCGMTEEVRSRAFEPFFTTKEPGKGTGLGLATIYGIVAQGAGHIVVRSAPGQGCMFEIYLPRIDEGQAACASPSDRNDALGGRETVLLAEDEDGVRALVRHVLQAGGYRVLEAINGEAALRVAQSHVGCIDLLVTDVVMPVMSGPELAQRLAPLHPATKMLFLSGYTDDAMMRHGVREDDVNFLQKPFTPSALARKVRDILDH